MNIKTLVIIMFIILGGLWFFGAQFRKREVKEMALEGFISDLISPISKFDDEIKEKLLVKIMKKGELLGLSKSQSLKVMENFPVLK